MNPYDKYTSDNEIPRLTDEVIRKKINESLRLGLTTMIMMLVSTLLAVWVMTGLGFYLKNHTLAGNYPVIRFAGRRVTCLSAAHNGSPECELFKTATNMVLKGIFSPQLR